MKTLQKIVEKFSALTFNEENYSVGGGLSHGKFASNRHEDAINDEGKLTLGVATQLFKKATGLGTDEVKEVIEYGVPNMEWHHAGRLPKSYGGGMKKTYFLNANEIVKLATNWNTLIEQLEISKAEKRNAEELKKNKEAIKQSFLESNAKKVVRCTTRPELFFETNREMNGKFGWFCSYGKSYNMTEYYTGWEFDSEEKYNKFINL